MGVAITEVNYTITRTDTHTYIQTDIVGVLPLCHPVFLKKQSHVTKQSHVVTGWTVTVGKPTNDTVF